MTSPEVLSENAEMQQLSPGTYEYGLSGQEVVGRIAFLQRALDGEFALHLFTARREKASDVIVHLWGASPGPDSFVLDEALTEAHESARVRGLDPSAVEYKGLQNEKHIEGLISRTWEELRIPNGCSLVETGFTPMGLDYRRAALAANGSLWGFDMTNPERSVRVGMSELRDKHPELTDKILKAGDCALNCVQDGIKVCQITTQEEIDDIVNSKTEEMIKLVKVKETRK